MVVKIGDESGWVGKVNGTAWDSEEVSERSHWGGGHCMEGMRKRDRG